MGILTGPFKMNPLKESPPQSQQNQETPVHMKVKGSKFNLNFSLGQYSESNYREKFGQTIIQRIVIIQIVLAFVISGLEICSMCFIRDFTLLESSRIGVWTSFLTILSAKVTLMTCHKLTLKRLMWTLVFSLISIMGLFALIFLACTHSIPSQKRGLYSYFVPADDPRYILWAVTLVLTSITILVAMFQLVLCLVVISKTVSAICTRSWKVEWGENGLETFNQNDLKCKETFDEIKLDNTLMEPSA